MNKIFEDPLYAYEPSPDQTAPTPVRHKVIVVGAGPVGVDLYKKQGMVRKAPSLKQISLQHCFLLLLLLLFFVGAE